MVPRRRRHPRRQRRATRVVEPARLPGRGRRHVGDRARDASPSRTRASPCRRSRCGYRPQRHHRRPVEDRRQRRRQPRPSRRRTFAAARHRRPHRLRDVAQRPGGARPVVVRLRRARRQRRRELLPVQPRRGGRRGDARAAGVPAARGMEPPDPIVVPDGEVVEFRMADVASLPDGPHSVVRYRAGHVGRRRADPHAARSRTSPRRRSPSVRPLGRRLRRQHVVRRPRPDGAGPTRLALYNNTTAAPAVSISAVTPQGIQAVSGLTDIAVAPGAIRYIDLTNQLTRQRARRQRDDPGVRRTSAALRA